VTSTTGIEIRPYIPTANRSFQSANFQFTGIGITDVGRDVGSQWINGTWTNGIPYVTPGPQNLRLNFTIVNNGTATGTATITITETATGKVLFTYSNPVGPGAYFSGYTIIDMPATAYALTFTVIP